MGYHIMETVQPGGLETRIGAIALLSCCDFEQNTFVGVCFFMCKINW